MNKDIRDSQKITTLPKDLQDIAKDMLEKKFGLSSEGEVIEKPKKVGTSHAKTGATETTPQEKIATSPFETAFEWAINNNKVAVDRLYNPDAEKFSTEEVTSERINITSDMLRQAHEAIAYQRGTTRDGVSAEVWVQSMNQCPGPYNIITYKSLYTNRSISECIPAQIMDDPEEAIYYIKNRTILRLQNHWLEPVIIMDPRR